MRFIFRGFPLPMHLHETITEGVVVNSLNVSIILGLCAVHDFLYVLFMHIVIRSFFLRSTLFLLHINE